MPNGVHSLPLPEWQCSGLALSDFTADATTGDAWDCRRRHGSSIAPTADLEIPERRVEPFICAAGAVTLARLRQLFRTDGKRDRCPSEAAWNTVNSFLISGAFLLRQSASVHLATFFTFFHFFFGHGTAPLGTESCDDHAASPCVNCTGGASIGDCTPARWS